MTSSRRTPERIDVIDVLRGFTLFGVLVAHIIEQYYAGQRPDRIRDLASASIADDVVRSFIQIFVSGKFYMIFSFLFGLSFYFQLSKTPKSVSFPGRFAWRLVILFIIGLVHHLHYRGDILTIYAMLGFGLLLLYRLPDRYLLVAAVLLLLNAPAATLRAIDAFVPGSTLGAVPEADQPASLQYFETLKSGSYLEILRANLFEFKPKMQFQLFSGRVYITFGLFLLGLYVGRSRVVEHLSLHLPSVRRALRLAAGSLLGCVLLTLVVVGAAVFLQIPLTEQVQRLLGGLVVDVFNAALATIYVIGVVLLFQNDRWHRRLMNFCEVGRMGLTTYLMQTVFGVLISFGIGLGLLGEIGASVSLAIGIAVFTIQIVFSKLWLKYFEYGIIEWLWRSLTCLRSQPLKRKTVGKEGAMSHEGRVGSALAAMVVMTALGGMSGGRAAAQANAQPADSPPNPYRVVENYFKLPEGRTLGSTAAVDIDRDGRSIWVFDRCGGASGGTPCAGSSLAPILKFDASGKLVKSFGAGMFVYPHGIHVDREGNVWVSDGAAKDGKGQQVFKFSSDGKLLMTLGKAGVAGDGPDTFNQPSDILVAPNGEVFVADGHGGNSNARIVKFSKDGKFIKAWGKKGPGPGEFDAPHSLAMDSSGRLFVADRGNSRIQIFDQDGKFLAEWKQFGRPSGVYIDKNDTLYSADTQSNETTNPGYTRGIRIGSAKDGKVTALVSDPDPDGTGEGVAVDTGGNVYGALTAKQALKRYVKK